jgi:hypothetical protein
LNIDNIKIKQTDNIYRNLHYSNIGIENATTTKPGLIQPSVSDFAVTNGILTLANSSDNIWTKSAQKIYYPNKNIIETSTLYSIGINIENPEYTLDVKGSINTSNGNFLINGSNLRDIIGNIADGRSASFSSFLLNNIDIVKGYSEVGFPYLPSVLKTNQAILTKNNGGTEWIITERGTETAIVNGTIAVNNINITNTVNTQYLITTNINIDTLTPGQPLIIRKGANKQLVFNNINGRLHIGKNIGDDEPVEKLVVDGNITATGYVRSYFSDNRLKTLTSNITNSLDIIDCLNGFYYVPNEKAIQLGFEYENEIGLSAQEVKKVIPELVKIAPFDSTKINDKISSKSGEEYLTICYERLGAVFVEAIKELRKENNSLKDEIKIIKRDLDNIKKIIYIQ